MFQQLVNISRTLGVETCLGIYQLLVCVRVVDEIYGLFNSLLLVLDKIARHDIYSSVNQVFVCLFFCHCPILLSKPVIECHSKAPPFFLQIITKSSTVSSMDCKCKVP